MEKNREIHLEYQPHGYTLAKNWLLNAVTCSTKYTLP